MSFSQLPTVLAQILDTEGIVGFYDSTLFPVSWLFPLTPDIIYLLAFLLDCCR